MGWVEWWGNSKGWGTIMVGLLGMVLGLMLGLVMAVGITNKADKDGVIGAKGWGGVLVLMGKTVKIIIIFKSLSTFQPHLPSQTPLIIPLTPIPSHQHV